MLARCPNCRATFSTERSGQQACPACGKPLIVPEQPILPASAPGVPRFGEAGPDAPRPEAAGTPWERRPELPLLKAWWDTVAMALFEPNKLFGQARLDKRGEQTAFAVLTFTAFSIINQIFGQLMSVDPAKQKEQIDAVSRQLGSEPPAWVMKWFTYVHHHEALVFVVCALLAPVVGFLFVYLSAAVTHLCAMIFGQNQRGFEATFAACAYAMAPVVLIAIPACGAPIATVWIVVLTGVGLKRVHGLTAGGATATALGPYILLCCGGCALLAILITAAKSVLSSGMN